MDTRDYLIKAGEKVDLKKIPTRYEGDLDKKDVKNHLVPKNLEKLQDYQERLYAENKQGLIIVLQAMDSGGKDSLIKHVMTGLNPQGTKVASFKRPSDRELDHDFLWRVNRELPSRGDIGIFNRSHYEEVIVTRIHDLVKIQPLPEDLIDKDLWQKRFDDIVNYENYLRNNGFRMVKFFLHISKEEQKSRLMDRIVRPEKHYKFDKSDITERTYWDKYQRAYEDLFEHTSTKEAPWYVVPADRKWFSRYLVSQVILETLQDMDPQFPQLSKEAEESLDHWKKVLEES
ncbi:polyphosphate kinase 2 family protein [Urinicoccus timonensis]|uniref:polyphosphate kinase 2 family protein n=1 Tax=Urinicoccus timonensis TaxID=2024205 RepID=UPI000C07950E|nr:polyphosphate kinase 2 family protein [Urinicoccus timonensis]